MCPESKLLLLMEGHFFCAIVLVSAGSPSSCNSLFIPPWRISPLVESSSSASLVSRRASFHYSMTDPLPYFIFLSLILASPLASITPNCICSSLFNPSYVFHIEMIRYSAHVVIYVPTSSLCRLVAYKMFSLSRLSCHPTVL